MFRRAVALAAGEVLTLAGLWLAWQPLALLAAGGQLVAVALLHDPERGDQGGDDE